jgi:hypothetical protein
MDLKTAVQFDLLADPSIHAVKAVPHSFARSNTMKRISAEEVLRPAARSFRRERLARVGQNLSGTLGAAVQAPVPTPTAVKEMLLRAAQESGLTKTSFLTYRVHYPGAVERKDLSTARERRGERTIHVLIGRGSDESVPSTRIVAIVATLEGRELVHIRRVHSR